MTTTTAPTTTEVLTAPVGSVVGSLVVHHSSWTPQQAAAAEAVMGTRVGYQTVSAWRTALGPANEVTLTGDGGAAYTDRWCRCSGVGDWWVRYERYGFEGQQAHGYVHGGCRMLLQAG